MPSTQPSTSLLAHPSIHHLAGATSHHHRPRRSGRSSREPRVLGRYTDKLGCPRELVTRQGFAGSVLVLDLDALTHDDRRLVAHLAADEPAENAALVSSHYLSEVPTSGWRCRALRDEDAHTAPFAELDSAEDASVQNPADADLVDRLDRRYRLEFLQSGMPIPELRWQRHPSRPVDREPGPVSLRDAIGSLESYEPVRTLTIAALARHRHDADISSTVLRAELKRVQMSPIVLNRKLREVVLRSAERRALSMSEIAYRCGRVKRDSRGNESGETSWLARRLGLLPEASRGVPTPWIHSDVLALISRHGLGVAPREVELG